MDLFSIRVDLPYLAFPFHQVITGSESHHNLVRQRIVSHISENCKAFSPLLPESHGNGNEHADACARYLSTSKMANGSTWGSDVEILAAAHLLRTRIFVYTMHGPAWQWVEHGMELTEPARKPCRDSIYLMHTGLVHYDLVEDVHKISDAAKDAAQELTAPTGHGSKTHNEQISRSRGYSVPCARAGPKISSRRRSNSRSSRNSSCSSYSSVDSFSSCGESVGSSMSHVNISGVYSRRKRPGVSSAISRRRFVPASSSYTYNNNNCLMKRTSSRSRRKTNMCPAPSKNHRVKHNPGKTVQIAPAASISLYKICRPGQALQGVSCTSTTDKNKNPRPGIRGQLARGAGSGAANCSEAETTGQQRLNRTRRAVQCRHNGMETRNCQGSS